MEPKEIKVGTRVKITKTANNRPMMAPIYGTVVINTYKGVVLPVINVNGFVSIRRDGHVRSEFFEYERLEKLDAKDDPRTYRQKNEGILQRRRKQVKSRNNTSRRRKPDADIPRPVRSRKKNKAVQADLPSPAAPPPVMDSYPKSNDLEVGSIKLGE